MEFEAQARSPEKEVCHASVGDFGKPLLPIDVIAHIYVKNISIGNLYLPGVRVQGKYLANHTEYRIVRPGRPDDWYS